MGKIQGVCREVCEATEFLAIVTRGESGPHVVGNWGEYLRRVGLREEVMLLPAGRYHMTEANLRRDNRIQVLVASKQVPGTRGPGQGCLIRGTAEIVLAGEAFDAVKAKFPWARGALVIRVDSVATQL